MKGLFGKWRRFLLRENIASSGALELYHFSSTDSDTIVLDPEYFKTNRRSYSRNDYNVSSFPRVFFYVDPAEGETLVKSQNVNLYVATVDAGDVYDLLKDPENLLQKSRTATGQTRPDYDKVFKSLTGEDKPHPNPEYAKYFTPIRDEDAKTYRGVYYRIHGGDTQVVVWFDKISAEKIDQKEREEK
jgi:hypothetical protein